MVKDYTIVMLADCDDCDFDALVKKHIKYGWQPVGGISSTAVLYEDIPYWLSAEGSEPGNTIFVFAQAMVHRLDDAYLPECNYGKEHDEFLANFMLRLEGAAPNLTK